LTYRTCEVVDCDRDSLSKGMCEKHYRAARDAANPDKRRAYNARYYAAHPERCIAASTKWQVANADRVRAKRVEHYAKNPDAYRAAWLLKNYKVSPSDYAAMLSAQGGGCAGCGATSGVNGTRLAVDHDHSCCPGAKSCGRCVRGLLCTDCNQTLGKMKDDPAALLRLAEYLTAHRGTSVNEWEMETWC